MLENRLDTGRDIELGSAPDAHGGFGVVTGLDFQTQTAIEPDDGKNAAGNPANAKGNVEAKQGDIDLLLDVGPHFDDQVALLSEGERDPVAVKSGVTSGEVDVLDA